jgi:hypothetical protein
MQNNQVSLNNIIVSNAMRTSLALQVFLHKSLALPNLSKSIQCATTTVLLLQVGALAWGPAGHRKFELSPLHAVYAVFIGFFILQSGKCRVFRWRVPCTSLDVFLSAHATAKGILPHRDTQQYTIAGSVVVAVAQNSPVDIEFCIG